MGSFRASFSEFRPRPPDFKNSECLGLAPSFDAPEGSPDAPGRSARISPKVTAHREFGLGENFNPLQKLLRHRR